MNDLRSQLMARLGAVAPPPEEAVAPVDDPFGADAHLDTDWVVRLRALGPSVGVPVPADAKLARCRQATDLAVKALKKAGRKREARELGELRAAYLGQRDKQAWSRVKARFKELDLSEKAYRALKQGGVEGERVLGRLDALGPADVAGVGAARLRELLEG